MKPTATHKLHTDKPKLIDSNNELYFGCVKFTQSKFRLFVLLFLLQTSCSIFAQQPTASVSPEAQYDTLWLSTAWPTSLDRDQVISCLEEPYYLLIARATGIKNFTKQSLGSLPTTISGSVTYDYLYRSLIDTPIYTRNFQQHTLSADIRVLYKGIYPVNLRFQVRKSNQPLFRDFTDLNIRFNPYDFRRVIENRVRQLLLGQAISPDLHRLQRLAEQLRSERDRLKLYVDAPETIQKIVEAREHAAVAKLKKKIAIANPTDTLNVQQKATSFLDKHKAKLDSLAHTELVDSSVLQDYQKRREQLADLQHRLKRIEDSVQKAQRVILDAQHKIKSLAGKLDGSKLKDIISSYHLPEDSLPAGYKKLLALRQLSAGRSMINYSELSAKNISITGANVEYNPSWYAAAAVGFTDWQFRDFRTIQTRLPKQYLALGRFGWGDKEKSSLIFTYFTGRRNLLSQYTTGTTGLSSFAISGVSIEGTYHVTPNQQLVLEVAKSSYPKYLGTDPVSGKAFESNWFQTKDRQNEAYSVSYKGDFIRMQTALQVSYKRIGQYFQSYAFYNTPGQQDAWNVQLDQRVKKWMDIRAGLQKNQYSYPMLAGGLKNDVVFKTIQMTLHYKRWPVVMFGYYPSSQITLIDNYIPVENRFYTLNVSANHGYNALHTYMNSTVVYTRFYNQSTDTGFIYYNSKNISLTQMAWVGKWNIQGSYTGIWQYLGRLDVLEANTSYKVSEAFGLSGAIKYNRLIGVRDVLGYSGGLTLILKKLGSFQGMLDKSYWPGQQHNLLPNTNGRLTFIKTF